MYIQETDDITALKEAVAGNYKLIKNLFNLIKSQQEEINIMSEMLKLMDTIPT